MTDQNWNYFYYQYDEVGNTTVDNKGTYAYDLNNNMISSSRTYTVNGNQVTSTGTYVFNGLGHRVKKNVSGQIRYFVYNENNQLIGEYDCNGNVIAEYIYFGLRPVAVKNGSNINIVHTDYLTTPRIVTSGGSIVWQWRNDNPYGNNLAQGTIEFNLRFAGQYYDAESGLHYNIHRTYNPEIGRYMQSDPLGLSAGSNTYNYVGRNPFDAVDPDGHNPLFIAGIGFVAGGISNGLNFYSQGKSFGKGFLIGGVIGASTSLIETAWLAGAVGGAVTQIANRIAGVNLIDTGNPNTDCPLETFMSGGIGAALGGIFGAAAKGIVMSSANKYIKIYSEEAQAVISNAYTTSYSNLFNAYTNLSGVLR